jgi:uncharacterized protein YoxC
MANNKYAGYSPKSMKPSNKQGQAYAGLEKGETYENLGNRLDRVNPYEFRKGMDYELVQMGCSRLMESTPEEREKATESVIKNLEEHQAYYSALIQFERGMNQGGKINESSFKKYLETYNGNEGRGDGMVEVDKEIKNDKMEEPKYDKSLYTLKEAIKREVKNILTEAKDDEDDKAEKKASKGAKKSSKGMKALDKEEEKLRDQKKKLQDKIFPLIQDFKNKKIDKDKYEKKVGDIPQQIKDINKRLGEIDKEKEAIVLKEKEDRRAVAETAMDREVHMELLNIIKEAGVSLREGSDGVKTYYEIAKIAYMEGLTAGLRGE